MRVRFENPVPDPPFPPKLLNVTTDVARLGEPSYLDQLALSAPHPMLLDAEMGMPIDLNDFDGVWDGDDSAINPVHDAERVLDPADAELLAPLTIGGPNGVAGAAAHTGPAGKPEVSWMRNTSYLAKMDGVARRRTVAETHTEVVDASEDAQIATIEKTFKDVAAQPLEGMRHPDAKRKHLRVVESYDILPDDESWPNSYIMIKFPERPSAATVANPGAKASGPRLDRAILRPVMEDDQQIMEYFLPKEEDVENLTDLERAPLDNEAVEKIRAPQEEGEENAEAIFNVSQRPTFPSTDIQNVTYERIRTYEVVMQAQPQKEILLTFVEDPAAADEEEEDMFGDEAPVSKKRKGVYFKDITMRTQLRKVRAKRAGEADTRADMWDKARVAFRVPYADEREERDLRAKAHADSHWAKEQLGTARTENENAAASGGEDAPYDDDD